MFRKSQPDFDGQNAGFCRRTYPRSYPTPTTPARATGGSRRMAVRLLALDLLPERMDASLAEELLTLLRVVPGPGLELLEEAHHPEHPQLPVQRLDPGAPDFLQSRGQGIDHGSSWLIHSALAFFASIYSHAGAPLPNEYGPDKNYTEKNPAVHNNGWVFKLTNTELQNERPPTATQLLAGCL